jgi:pyrroloquinoline quinone biosynthesis protein E
MRLYTIIAELTYRCPLRCVYCSNPIDFAAVRDLLSTSEWSKVFQQGAALGALQVHLSGGEPTLRPDLPELIRAARDAELYVNLITAGTLLEESKLQQWRASGLDHVQLSLQDSDRQAAELVAGVHSFDKKLEAARLIREAGLPLTLNVVLHRWNIGRVSELVELARSLGADRLELANVQYYGWAMPNRELLLPTRKQYDTAEQAVRAARANGRGQLEIAFVRADYFADRPKPCMGGWANSYVCITPEGAVLPCHAARVIPGLHFDNVRERPLAQIWHDSLALNAFRGEDWMIEPCRSCPNRTVDFGGCRCQAFLLGGDARTADPVCSLSPAHHVVEDAVSRSTVAGSQPIPYSGRGQLIYRDAANSRRLAVTQ